jgi:Xaa-Pro aminopeptidase
MTKSDSLSVKDYLSNCDTLGNLREIIYPLQKLPEFTQDLSKIYTLNNLPQLLKLGLPNLKEITIDHWCQQQRVLKNPTEINSIRLACQISSRAIGRIISKGKSFKNEQEVVSFFKQDILNEHIDKMAYLPICSNGNKNSTLHYTFNQNPIEKKNLILLDIGCQYQNYCSDITRTFPASGKFSLPQKKIYQAVLNCQKKAIQKLTAGFSWKQLEKETRLDIYQELLSLGIVKEQSTTKKKLGISHLFMPHKLGHTVGLQVHDCNPVGGLDILEANMVVAVEPGIYFIEHLISNKMVNQTEVSKYLQVGGVRIEDTILITSNRAEVLSNVPKDIKEIERLMSFTKKKTTYKTEKIKKKHSTVVKKI